MKKIVYICLFTFFIVGCRNSENKTFLTNSSGQAGEVIVVIENELWDSQIGDSLKFTLAQSQIALPQPEPIFNLVKVPPAGFKNLFKLHRNILFINISSEIPTASVTFEENKWAGNQLVLYLNAPNNEEFLTLFEKNKLTLISKILDAERNRLMSSYRSAEDKEIRENIQKHHKLSMYIPHGYDMSVDTTSFAWISKIESGIDQGILIYYYPYYDEKDFSKENLIKKRNETLKKYVHGVSEGSYMTTEDLVPVYLNSYYKKNGLYIAEMRGLWKLENGFMGGPFVSQSTVDTVYNRIVTVEGYVFAPQKDKRNLVRQLEAILHTLKIIK